MMERQDGERAVRKGNDSRGIEKYTGGHLARAAKEDALFITKLWQEAFGDSEEYIGKFLEVHQNTKEDESRVFLWKENGLCRTMLFALPAKIKQAGAIKNARYLYAIATERENRGKKYLRRMLPELKQVFGEDCVFFLVPEPGVIPYYESLGFLKRQAFRGFCYEKKENKTSGYLAAASMEVILHQITDASDYYRLREENLKDTDHIVWDVPEISWALCDISMAQGMAYVVECDYGKYLLAGIDRETEIGRCFSVIETTLPAPVLAEVYEDLLEVLGCRKMIQKELSYMIESEQAEGELYLSLALNG